ncbi:MAG: diguanylate cyclase [Candidatus Thorarchaeota archaeon]|nr:MAG: diguanylate cyclase [Candidatus Thorarchaeota archaeon]
MADLAVTIAGIQFKNPVLTAAGPTTRDGESLLKAASGGAGGLVTKTVSVKPAAVAKPNMAVLQPGKVGSRRGMLNAELWSELPLDRWIKYEYPLALGSGLPVIASIGYTPQEVSQIGPMVEEAGVSAIEFSTHYVGGHKEIAKTLRDCVSIPIFAKLSPQVDVAKVAKELEQSVDGIVAINTLGPCLHIDIETGRPVLGGEKGYGWLSGAAIKPLALRCVADIAQTVKIPVIAVGGVMSGEDAVEFFMAGASAVQVCTAAILDGPSVYGKISTEIGDWLDKHGHKSIESIRGLALSSIGKTTAFTYPPTVDTARCNFCGLCSKSCVYSAISVNKEKEFFQIDRKKCAACGLCVAICPQSALSAS